MFDTRNPAVQSLTTSLPTIVFSSSPSRLCDLFEIHDLRSSPNHPLGDAVEVFVRREEAKRFIESGVSNTIGIDRAVRVW